MRTGTVKWFNTRKGYGYLKPVDGGFDARVEIAAVKRAGLVELKEGQKINFEMVVDKRTGEVYADYLNLPPISAVATSPWITGWASGIMGRWSTHGP